MKLVVVTTLYKSDGGYYTHELDGHLYEQLQEASSELHLCARVSPKNEPSFDSRFRLLLKTPIVEIGHHHGLRGLLSVLEAGRLALELRNADYVYSFSGSLAIKTYLVNAIVARKPLAIYERGRWLDEEYLAARFAGRLRFLAPLYGTVMGRLRRLMLRAAHVVYVHGQDLYQECASLGVSKLREVVQYCRFVRVIYMYDPIRVMAPKSGCSTWAVWGARRELSFSSGRSLSYGNATLMYASRWLLRPRSWNTSNP